MPFLISTNEMNTKRRIHLPLLYLLIKYAGHILDMLINLKCLAIKVRLYFWVFFLF